GLSHFCVLARPTLPSSLPLFLRGPAKSNYSYATDPSAACFHHMRMHYRVAAPALPVYQLTSVRDITNCRKVHRAYGASDTGYRYPREIHVQT
ncbi:hypothetical protein PFISCL1PPCAC_22518, partial [Pristionchus fissidentatus]